MSDQPTAGPFTPEQEARIREIIREEDFLVCNYRYPSWAKNVPAELSAVAKTDRQPQHLVEIARRLEGGS